MICYFTMRNSAVCTNKRNWLELVILFCVIVLAGVGAVKSVIYYNEGVMTKYSNKVRFIYSGKDILQEFLYSTFIK